MNLKEIRTSQNLSVPELSKNSGVPIRTIENIERNNNCNITTAILLADALKISLDELCGYNKKW
jgi:transcriptional regulator with XRE-family HTH domain